MNALRVLVCGTNYGRVYLEAIRFGGNALDLAGILGRGSPRSQQLARDFGLPLYSRVEDIPAGIDLACAAMGTSGAEVVLHLLSRGINVLCEHPQKPGEIRSALEVANSRGVCFHVNGHFATLDSSVAFISDCCRKNTIMPPLFYQVTATDRSLYAVLDILRRIVTSFTPYEFHVNSQLQPFTVVQGILGGVPLTLNLQCGEMNSLLPDGSSSYLVDHRIAAGFRRGIVTLLSMNGPVVWNANLNSGINGSVPLQKVIYENRALTTETLKEQRVSANLSAISAIVKHMREGVRPPEQAPDYLLEVSSAWDILGSLLPK